jgi:3-oxoacyl-[acyl-carrier-protein] synthase II
MKEGDMMRKRVVVTGMGMVSPLGNSVSETYGNMIQGKNGIARITLDDPSEWKVKLAGEVKNLDPERVMDKKDIKRSDRVAVLAMVAADEAWRQSGLDATTMDPYRLGTFVSSGIGGLNTILEEVGKCVTQGPDRISPFFIPNSIINLIGGKIAMRYKAKGPNIPVVTACSAATNSIGEAFRSIRHGYIDAAFAGGAEAPVNALGIGGFANLRALATTEDPDMASLPFDSRRSGFVIAEGAGVMILESLDHALARGATILAEVIGYGSTTDAYHMTAPDPEAEGIEHCLKHALDDAGITPSDVGYINAHGTATALNDPLETLGIKKAFGPDARTVSISSTKSMTGHALGAAGAIESITVVKTLMEGIIPPTINLDEPDPECDLDYTPHHAVKKDVSVGININIGFGGQNAAVVFRKWTP